MNAQHRTRAEFEAWVAANHPAAPLDRIPSRPDDYDGVLAAWTWAAWQAASARHQAMPEPVACIYKAQALVPGSVEVTHVALYRPLAAGTLLYAAPPAHCVSNAPAAAISAAFDLACSRAGAAYRQSGAHAPS